MADVTILHNPRCTTSKAALAAAEAAGTDVEVVQYLKTPLTADQLRDLIGKLEDPVADLVRHDSFFKELGLSDADVATSDQIVDLLVAHPRLMQRPILIRGDRAIIGRPKDRVPDFLR
ncbi:arsenate reductase (glutaredoxin) [Granulicoccus phenolivorans]|uniref:arsenate reductase (glutaredoxin) n=1 Tax=Granulicoccus phenolivorans TaxID=266854 RepID=UPI00047A6588|nr:arsenate reductase (glutaredoxin) [Granulicoccus phenolivorans]